MSSKSKSKSKAKRPPVKQQAATVETVAKQSRTEYIVVNIICLLVFLAFGYIALMSFFQTSVIDPTKYTSEHILFQNDILPLNILFTVLFIAFLFAMRRFYNFFARVNITAMEIGLAVFAVVLGLIWVFSVQSVPAADSYNVYEAASDAAIGQYKSMQDNTAFYNSAYYSGLSYFHFYPFQLGYVAFSELIYRIFGDSYNVMQIINVLCVGASYFALARMTRLLFKRKSIEFIAILLLALCLQPILFTPFMYGNIPGMCAAVWASLLLIKYFQTGSYRWAAVGGVLLIVSVLVKYNNMIYLVAFVIMLVLHIIKEKKWQSAVIAAALIASTLLSSTLVTAHYESRSGTDFESGVSQTLYLDMGLQESYMAPGWYTGIAKDTYLKSFLEPKLKNGLDVDISAAEDKAKEDIDKRMEKFGEDFDYTLDFFSKKILSQWNEPTFESIWVSKVKNHVASEEQQNRFHTKTIDSGQVGGLAQSVYYKSTGQMLELHFSFYMQMLYVMFAAGIYLLFINKKTNIETVLLPLVIMGGFGYHLLFEGKSQYILTYIPLFIPTAAYAFNTMICGRYERIKRFFAKFKSVPDRFNEI